MVLRITFYAYPGDFLTIKNGAMTFARKTRTSRVRGVQYKVYLFNSLVYAQTDRWRPFHGKTVADRRGRGTIFDDRRRPPHPRSRRSRSSGADRFCSAEIGHGDFFRFALGTFSVFLAVRIRFGLFFFFFLARRRGRRARRTGAGTDDLIRWPKNEKTRTEVAGRFKKRRVTRSVLLARFKKSFFFFVFFPSTDRREPFAHKQTGRMHSVAQ